MTAITAPGIYTDMSALDYFADPCPGPSLTQSLCKVLLDRSPAHARLEHPRLAPPKAEDEPAEKYIAAQAIGNAAHALMIGRGKTIAECCFDSWRSDKAKAARAEAEAAGRMAILTHHLTRAVQMVEAARRQLDDMRMTTAFRNGNGEVVVVWQEAGLWYRTMIDFMVNPTLLLDYKTTGLSVAPHAVPKLMVDAGWDLQAAMQERGLDALDPGHAGRRTFRFIAQENEPPYALTICELTEAVMTMGRKKLAMAMDIWQRCMERDEWPAYPLAVQYPEYPGYAETRWLDREVAYDARREAPAKRSEPMLTSLMGG